jgi:uncharacterized protein (TIGR02611 family)
VSGPGKGEVTSSTTEGGSDDVRSDDGPGDGAEDDNPVDPRGWGRRFQAWRESIRARPRTYRIYRLVVGIVGFAIVAGGLALVPLPGPGWVIVFLGLALLATEFEWAARVEQFARDQVKAWTRWLGDQPLVVRVLIGLLTFAFVVAAVYGLFVLTGVPGWIPDSWVPALPGL